EALEGRLLMTSLSDILRAYETGRQLVAGRTAQISDAAFNLDLPMVKQDMNEAFGLSGLLGAAFAGRLDPADPAALTHLPAGFTNVTDPARGDLLRLNYSKVITLPRANFEVAGKTGFSYFDDNVTGEFSGVLAANARSI